MPGKLIFSTTADTAGAVSSTESLIIWASGCTALTRLANGGIEHLGNTGNQWFKIGTWSGPGVDSAARCNITVLGTDTHNSGANLGGETKIYLGFDSVNVCRGNYHSVTAGYAGLIGVAHKYDSTAKSLEIWVRYQGGYGMTQCFADVSTGFFTGTSAATGSTSVPAGATELGSDYRLLTSNGTNSLTSFSVSGSTQNVYIGEGNLGFSTAGKGITLGNTSVGTAANTLDDYEEGTWTPTNSTVGFVQDDSLGGSYTKIGNRVFFDCIVKFASNSSSVGAYIDGFPFTSAGSGSNYDHGASITYTTDSNANSALVGNGDTRIYLYTSGGSTPTSATLSTDYVRLQGQVTAA